MPGWLTDGIGGLIEKGLDAAMRWLLKSLLSALEVVLNGISEWWLGISGPGMGEGSPAAAVQNSTLYFVAVAGIIGTAFGIVRVVRTHSKDASVDLVMAIFATVAVTAIGGTAATYLLKASDAVAPWLLSNITGQGEDERKSLYQMLDIMPGDQSAKFVIGLAIVSVILVLVAALASVVNALFVIFSYGMVAVLVGLLPILAAQSQTQAGKERFWKVMGWIFAAVLYKPTAAIIYGVGSLWIKGMVTEDQKGDAFAELVSLISGMVVIVMACLALPALIKIVTVATTDQARGVGAGGAIAAGAGAIAVGSLGLAAAAGGGAASGASATSTGGGSTGLGSGASAAASSDGSASAMGSGMASGGEASSPGGPGSSGQLASTGSSGSGSSSGSASGPEAGSGGNSTGSASGSEGGNGGSGSGLTPGAIPASAASSDTAGAPSSGTGSGSSSGGFSGGSAAPGSVGESAPASESASEGESSTGGSPASSGAAGAASSGGEPASAAPMGGSGGGGSSAVPTGANDSGHVMSPNMARALAEAGRFTATSAGRQLQDLEHVEN